MQLFNF